MYEVMKEGEENTRSSNTEVRNMYNDRRNVYVLAAPLKRHREK